MKQPKRILDPSSVWKVILSIGEGWTIQAVADQLNSATGESWTRQGVSKIVNKHGLKEKWDDLQKLARGASPEFQGTIERVARRMKLEDLSNSTLALEAYNEAIIKAADHLATRVPEIKLEKPADFAIIANALAIAIQAQTTSRKELAEIISMIGKPQDDPGDSKVNSPETTGNVLSMRDRVSKAAGK